MYLVADVGGTHTRIAFTDLKNLMDVRRFDTPTHYLDFLNVLGDLTKGKNLTGACLGLPGVLTKDKRSLFHAPNLQGWGKVDLSEDLERAWHAKKVLLENDTALLGLGESSTSAMKNYQVVAFLGLGTGVGGVRIDGGKIEHAAFGFEPGHQIIDYRNGVEWESLVGGRDIEQATGKKIAEIDDDAFWDEKHEILAAGIYNLILMWSPEVVILGGGMVIKGTYRLELIREKLNNINKLLPELPPLVKTQLGDDAGLFGAMHYIKQQS